MPPKSAHGHITVKPEEKKKEKSLLKRDKMNTLSMTYLHFLSFSLHTNIAHPVFKLPILFFQSFFPIYHGDFQFQNILCDVFIERQRSIEQRDLTEMGFSGTLLKFDKKLGI